MGALLGMAGGAIGGIGSMAGGLLSSAGGLIGPAMKMGGPLMDIMGQQQQGAATEADLKAQENLYEYKAKVAEQDAEAARQRAKFDQMRHAKRTEEVKGLMSARMGAAGAAGSPVALDVKMAQAEELELENLLIGYEGEVAAMRAESQAGLDRYQASILKQKRRSAKKGSQFDMFGKILTGFTDIFS